MAKALNWNQVTGFGPPLCFRNDLTRRQAPQAAGPPLALTLSHTP